MIRNILITGAIATFTAIPAYAASLDKRVDALEKKLQSLQQTYLSNNREIASAVSRAEHLQREAAALQGTIEGLEHRVETNEQQSQRHVHDFNTRLRVLEDRMELVLRQVLLALTKLDPKLADEAEAYQKGLDHIQSGSVVEGIAAFQQFIKAHQKSELVSKARFWIADGQFQLQNYRVAIKSYQHFIDQHPQDDNVPSALLKQALSFDKLNMTDAALPFLEKIQSKHAETPEAKEAAELRERIEQKKREALPETEPTEPQKGYPDKTVQEEQLGQETP